MSFFGHRLWHHYFLFRTSPECIFGSILEASGRQNRWQNSVVFWFCFWTGFYIEFWTILIPKSHQVGTLLEHKSRYIQSRFLNNPPSFFQDFVFLKTLWSMSFTIKNIPKATPNKASHFAWIVGWFFGKKCSKNQTNMHLKVSFDAGYLFTPSMLPSRRKICSFWDRVWVPLEQLSG